jgi:hypothetical protein
MPYTIRIFADANKYNPHNQRLLQTYHDEVGGISGAGANFDRDCVCLQDTWLPQFPNFDDNVRAFGSALAQALPQEVYGEHK